MTDWNAILAGIEPAFDAFKETAVYHKRDGTTRTIRVEVDDYPPTSTKGSDGAVAPKKVIRVGNNTTDGISAAEAELSGQDSVELRVAPGNPATVRLSLFRPPPEFGVWVDGGRCTFFLW